MKAFNLIENSVHPKTAQIEVLRADERDRIYLRR
jgi:hypothetical protein